MREKIDKTLKRITNDTSKANIPISSSINRDPSIIGDPNCQYCHGIGYLRLEVPVDHPEFGKLQICDCRKVEASQIIRERLYALSKLDQLQHLTFENFHPEGLVGTNIRQSESLKNSYAICHHYSSSLNGWLVLQGGFGCGKTHLAAAIANKAVSLGVPTLFLTVPDLLDKLRFSYDNDEISFEERFEEIRSANLVILDDFGTQNATEWAKEKLFQIINYRYINRLALVLTTNLQISDIDGRIRSRLEDPELVEVVKIDAPDFRRYTDKIGYHELSSLNTKESLTFATFSQRRSEGLTPEEIGSLEKAFRAAQDFAKKPGGWLVFLGPFSTGKTHLAAAIAHYLDGSGRAQLFISVPEFLDHLRATFSSNSAYSFDQRFDQATDAEILILDDLSTQTMSPWVKEKLHQLFTHRYENHKPTVITSADTLESMDARIRSRMLDRRICTIYTITSPPYTGGEVKPVKHRVTASKKTVTKKLSN